MISDPHHRARFRQLWIDRAREQLDQNCSPTEFEHSLRLLALAELADTGESPLAFARLPPVALNREFARHDLVGPMEDVALRALKKCGYPKRGLTTDEATECRAKLGSALNWLAYTSLLNPDLCVFLLDDEIAKAVTDSKNDPITPAELQFLPHNPCLIEFYRPIEIAENVKRGFRIRAVGFQSLGGLETPAAAVIFYLDLWQTYPYCQIRTPAAFGIWFGGVIGLTVDHVIRRAVGFEMGSATEKRITEVCETVARNLWDFVTSRSIRYERVPRKPDRQFAAGKGPSRIEGFRSANDREVTFLYLSRECKLPDGSEPGRRGTLDHRIEIPGTFHELVYCARCGDLHRHDLLGQGCRQCGEIVGPRLNLRVEKYWHCPHTKGPEDSPRKEVVRDLRPNKPR